MNNKKRIAVFGSTGSIGTQCLDVIKSNVDLFEVSVLTAHSNEKLLIEQALFHKPHTVVIVDDSKFKTVKDALSKNEITVLTGDSGLAQAASEANYDFMMAGIVGFAGMVPTIEAIKKQKTIGLANKETLVVAGEYIMQLAKENNVKILPVDSEHSAIFQCLVGEENNPIEKIILTASGGPFLGKKPNFLVNVKREHALQHPNWTMGAKITIDSATLMNKGLEIIEAKWLFDLEPNQIEVIVHAQSIVHSIVQFEDGSMKAQMGVPDMKLPIQYSMGYPNRIKNDFPRFQFKHYNNLSFDEPDRKTFRNLALAEEALKRGGNAPCVLNAANEIAVWAFLQNKIGFLDITTVIEQSLEKIEHNNKPNLQDYFDSDAEARNFAATLLKL